MGIEDDDIGRVRDASDIVAVVSEHVQLKRVGRRFVGLCPFHGEKSASFSVNQEAGLYYCFGCRASGDVITFVREIEHLDFVGAVEKLAGKAGVALRYTNQGESEGRKRKAKLTAAMRAAVEWYHERLLAAPDAASARGYLRSRGLTGDEVRRYQLGWAPEGWDELSRSLKLPSDVLIDSGVARLNRFNKPTDVFRARVLFPIFDVNGDPVAFGGRVLPGTDGAKYINSSESDIYAKSKTLYGLNWSKADIVAADQAIVCEGYTDVIGFASAGIGRAVATCGTSLTDQHFQALKSYAHQIVLAFDADAAGQNAAERFYAWERQYDIGVSVAALAPGVDPADLARSDPEGLRAAVAGAVPFLGFRVNRALNAGAMATPEGRARAAEAALAVIAEHPSDLVRDQYLMEVASRTQIDPERLRADATRRRNSPAARTPTVSGAGPGAGRGKTLPVDRVGRGRSDRRPPARENAEMEALRLLIINPDAIRVWLHDVMFADDRALASYRALVHTGAVREAIEAAEPGAAELLQRLAAEDSEADPADVVDLLIAAASRRELAEFESQARLGDDPLAFAADTGWVKLRLEELQESGSREGAREQLLAWLIQETGEQAGDAGTSDEQG
jgi:DNA primase